MLSSWYCNPGIKCLHMISSDPTGVDLLCRYFSCWQLSCLYFFGEYFSCGYVIDGYWFGIIKLFGRFVLYVECGFRCVIDWCDYYCW